MGRFLVALLLFVAAADLTIACDSSEVYDVNLSVGRKIILKPVRNCKWSYKAAAGFRIKISCSKFALGHSETCTTNYVEIDGKKYCGTKLNWSVVSLGNTADFITVGNGQGKLSCEAIAYKDPCDCGRRKMTRIVGGTNTGVHEFPYQAVLVDEFGSVQCGATIIDQNYVLTAAHCVVNKDVSTLKVRVGEHDTSTEAETSWTRTLNVLKIIPHPAYNSATNENDIALVRTKITLNENVDVVCLPFSLKQEKFSSNEVVVAGWGSTEFGGPKSNILQKVDLDTISNDECTLSYPNLTSDMICTKTEDKDTCQSDSGGNLYYTNPSNSLLYSIGIVSGGLGCAGANPSLNTRVTSYLDWIVANTPEAKFCNV